MKAKMPAGVGRIYWSEGVLKIWVSDGASLQVGDSATLITTDQAEAYAQAVRREALEEAYHELIDLHQSLLGNDVPASTHPAQIANFAANRVATLIPKETT